MSDQVDSKAVEVPADSDRDQVLDALGEILFPPFDQVDLNAPSVLTNKVRSDLAALGGPEEQVAAIMADPKILQQDTSTRAVMSATSNTQISAFPDAPEIAPDFEDLLQGLRDCEEEERLGWSYDYRKKKVIGRGGQGTVYLTECLNEHNLPKALKVFSPKPYGNVDAYYRDMERMGQVAQLVYRMQVDNLVTIERFAYHQGSGICVMIMRWIDGHDLATLLKPGLLEKLYECVDQERWDHLNDVVISTRGTIQARLKPGMAVNIIEKCLRAMDVLHSQGIVHGDIKPSNIMLDRYGSIRIVDIGSAFDVSAPPLRHTSTPRYAPPEVFKGEVWTPHGDLASLGYVLVEMLSGHPALYGADVGSDSTRVPGMEWDKRLLQAKLELPERLGELLPPDVQESEHLMNIIRRLIDPDPSKRFANAEDALVGPSGAYQFMQGLTRMDLSAPFCQVIKHWLEDVQAALGR